MSFVNVYKLKRLAEMAYDAVEAKYGEGTLSPDGSVNISRLRDWANYIRGAITATRLLTGEPSGGPRYLYMSSKLDEKVYDRAFLELILSSSHAMSCFLSQAYEIRYKDHQRDKKGNLVKCRAYFARKRIKYEEVEP